MVQALAVISPSNASAAATPGVAVAMILYPKKHLSGFRVYCITR
jgi:hypothetical protein